MLTVGDKIKMVKQIGDFECLVERVFEVTNVRNGVISLMVDGVGIGVMSEDEFKKYFVMVRNWTKWIHTVDFYAYKTDNKKYVKVRCGEHLVRASCHPNDNFNLLKGIEVGLGKIKTKLNA